MDCPVHSAKMIDDTKTEIGGEAMHLEVPKQETVCCGCLGTDYCETCPVHGKTTHPVGICDVVGHDCSQVIEKRRISISGVPVGSKMEDLEVGDQVDIVDGAFANFKGRIVDILRPNNTIQLDVLIFGRTEKVMLPASQVRLIPKYKSDTFPGPSAAEERAVRLEKDMQVELAAIEAGKKQKEAHEFASIMAKKGLCRDDFFSIQIQVAEINKWNDDTIYAMKKYVNALPNKTYSDPKAELQVSMNDLVADMGGETDNISMKDIKKAAKQAGKKTKAVDIANDMVANSHCSISGRAFSNQVEKIMGWSEEKINSAWQPLFAKQANKKKPAKKTKTKKTTKVKK
jgi:hypothetical protein